MLIQQFFVRGIAHSSYILAGKENCAVIDPRRDADIYIEAAKALGVKITHILETHLHADFISGHIDLAEATGAKIYGPKSGNCEFEHVGLSEGDSFEIEDMKVRVLETPGHTPEHISYVVSDTSRGPDPVALFCGDTLFVGDVGRPDLFPGRAEELASRLYDSLHSKLLSLPDSCEVYPAHGAGSLCGRSMGAKRSSTIGYERKYNYALQIPDRERFVEALTTDMPPSPDHFSRCSNVNREGPAKLDTLPPIRGIPPSEFFGLAGKNDTLVLDTRCFEGFGGNMCQAPTASTWEATSGLLQAGSCLPSRRSCWSRTAKPMPGKPWSGYTGSGLIMFSATWKAGCLPGLPRACPQLMSRNSRFPNSMPGPGRLNRW